jgi:hypothetical protein
LGEYGFVNMNGTFDPMLIKVVVNMLKLALLLFSHAMILSFKPKQIKTSFNYTTMATLDVS